MTTGLKEKGRIRRWGRSCVAVIVFLFWGTICFGANPVPAPPDTSGPKVLAIGHRGGAGLWPENTLSAFAKACEMRLDGIEMDVLLTADNEMVIHHDFRLKQEIARQPDGQWLNRFGPAIRDLSLDQLKQYDVGRLKPFTAYALRYPWQEPVDGQSIPTLAEVVSLVKDCGSEGMTLWIEIKTSPEEPGLSPSMETLARSLAALIAKEDLGRRTRVLSFDWRALLYFRKIAPDIPTVYLSSNKQLKPGIDGRSPWTADFDPADFDGSIPRAVRAAGGVYWAPNYKTITPEMIAEAHALGLKVIPWTPDAKTPMERLISQGVDGIITNRPDILKALLP